jgi:3-hydroxyacyl-CoA dehydrogenase
MDIKQVGLVGGGVMGAGIVQTLSSCGYPVYFKDVNDELVSKCFMQVEKIYLSAVKKGKLTGEQAKEKISLVKGGTDDKGFEQADLVIEAVPENIEIKRQVFHLLDRICKPGAILATNTSSLSVSQIATFTSRNSQVIGMHWFNPSHVMKLIEIVSGIETSPETVESVIDFCGWLGKIPIQVKECAGFLVNRILGIYMNEALFMLEEEGTPTLIDQAAINLGMPMGPLMLGDMVGWDVIYHSNQTLHEEYGTRFALPKLFSKMVEEGKLGQKVKNGIYPAGQEFICPEHLKSDARLQVFSNRLLFAMLNEGIRCLEEKVASASNIDRALQLGTAMPKGPIVWADELGLDILFQGLEQFKVMYGERFWPSPLLRRLVQAGYLGNKSGKGLSILI